MGIPKAKTTASESADSISLAPSPSSSSTTSLPSNHDPEFATLFEDAIHRAASSSSSNSKGNANATATLSQEEQQRFLKAMQDSEFRSLLHDYMEEISDPANRAETEQYLRQLEQEQHVPKHRQLVRPTPGFVVKTQWYVDTSKASKEAPSKLFVNVCSSKLLQPPSSTAVDATAGKHAGTSWRLPYSLGPLRWEDNKRGAKVQTFDVCFHPTTVKMAMAQRPYRDMVVHTALDAIEPQMRETLRKPQGVVVRQPYHVLKGISYKSGEPVTMNIKMSDAVEDKKAAPQKPKQEEKKQLKTKGTKTEKPLIEVVASKSNNNEAPTKAKPKVLHDLSFQIIHRGRFDMLDHMEATNQVPLEQRSQRPRELLVDISFPTSQTSAASIDLDVSERKVLVTGKGFAPLHIKLPFPVLEAKGTAKFDKQLHRLRVTLPVQAPLPPAPKAAPMEVLHDDETASEEDNQEDNDNQLEPDVTENGSLDNNNDDQTKDFTPMKRESSPPTFKDDAFRMFRETALMVSHDPLFQARHDEAQQAKAPSSPASPSATPPVEVPVSSSSPESLDAAIDHHVASNAELFDDLPPLEDDPELLAGGSPCTESSSLPDQHELQIPAFTLKETATHCSYIIHQAKIDATTVTVAFDNGCHVHFSLLESVANFQLVINLESLELDTTKAEWHVASENMIVTIPKRRKVIQTPPTTLPPVAHIQNSLLYDLD